MKSASPTLIALLNSNEFLFADLYTITLLNGTILRYTNADGGLVYANNYFSQAKIERQGTKSSVGVTVDTMAVEIFYNESDLVLGIRGPQFARQGGFDGATFQVDKCFMNVFGNTTAGVVNVFLGSVSRVSPTRSKVSIEVSSILELLNVAMPRNLLSPGCMHTLYDSGCGLSKAAFSESLSASSVTENSQMGSSSIKPDGYYDAGTVIFSSGANISLTRTIKKYVAGEFFLAQPLPDVLEVGDTFTAYAGCNKSQATCTNKFNNVINFKCFPFVPVPTASL